MAGRLFFALPGSIETRTGGTIYDKRLLAGLQALGWEIELAEWQDSFPFPRHADRASVARDLARLPDGTIAMIDGLAFGVLGREAAIHAERLRLVALVHHPLALESGLSTAAQADFQATEQAALRLARAVVVTSRTTAEDLAANYGVESRRITVAPPGIDAAPAAARLRPTERLEPMLLAVGTVSPRKGYDLLVAALEKLTDLSWRCRIAGSLERAPEAAGDLRQRIAAAGLANRIELMGEVASMAPLYAEADIFTLPSRHEGYGIAFAEALCHGLPVIGCRAGAVPEVVPDDAGILVEPDDVAGLSRALASLIANPARRRAMAVAAQRAAAALPDWAGTAARVDMLLKTLQN